MKFCAENEFFSRVIVLQWTLVVSHFTAISTTRFFLFFKYSKLSAIMYNWRWTHKKFARWRNGTIKENERKKDEAQTKCVCI